VAPAPPAAATVQATAQAFSSLFTVHTITILILSLCPGIQLAISMQRCYVACRGGCSTAGSCHRSGRSSLLLTTFFCPLCFSTQVAASVQGSKLSASSSSTMLHIEVAPAPPAAATAQATARRILGGVRVQYLPSGQVARRLHMASRTLGKITGQHAID